MSDATAAVERKRLERGLSAIGLPAEPGQVDALQHHADLIRKWAVAYNLVARGDLDALVERHVLDSLAIHPWLRGDRLLDVGSGAGFPGVPLAIVRPQWRFTLLDSAGKRIRFLRQVVRTLELDNVKVVQCRAEEYVTRHAIDTIISRAFSSLTLFAQRVRHLSGPETRVVAIKGRVPEEELSELPEWVSVNAIEAYDVPGLHAERHVVIMSLSPIPA